MNRIQRYQEYNKQDELAYEFLENLDSFLNENDDSDKEYNNFLKKIVRDLKLNINLIATFGTGIGAFYSIVDGMMRNMSISSEITPKTIVLLTICSLTIIYLEEKKFKSSKEESDLINDSKSMLEELKMMGIGNGIVKIVMKSFRSIKNLFSIIGKHIGAVAGGVIDMFGYTSLMIPVMNGIDFLVHKYDLTPETLTQNLIGLAAGIGTIVAKHGIIYIVNKLKNRFKIKKDDIIDDIETPAIQKFGLYNNIEDDGSEPINEQ